MPDGVPARMCYNCNRKQCLKCFKPKGQREFDRHTWQLDDNDPGRFCLACANGPREVGMWICRKCTEKKPISEFSLVRAKHGAGVKGNSKRCNACVERFEAECAAIARSSASHVQKRRRTE